MGPPPCHSREFRGRLAHDNPPPGGARSLLRAVAVTYSGPPRWTKFLTIGQAWRLLPGERKSAPRDHLCQNQTNRRKRLASTVHGALRHANIVASSSDSHATIVTWNCMVIATSCSDGYPPPPGLDGIPGIRVSSRLVPARGESALRDHLRKPNEPEESVWHQRSEVIEPPLLSLSPWRAWICPSPRGLALSPRPGGLGGSGLRRGTDSHGRMDHRGRLGAYG